MEISDTTTHTKNFKEPHLIQDIITSETEYIKTTDNELNILLGGGIVKESVILVGGDPGIGKSTLVLQIVLSLTDIKSLYISGEESEAQVAMRARRLKRTNDQCFIVHTTDIKEILQYIALQHPQFVVIDSIQTIVNDNTDGTTGSAAQIRDTTNQLIQTAKQFGTSIIIIGHITKEGLLAGPKLLEHMVDVVLHFESDDKRNYRILRSEKNRFGHTPEIAIYKMCEDGLFPIDDPSAFLLSSTNKKLSGVAIGTICEGQRAILVEIQSLIGITNYATPQRVANGFDMKRLNILIAILEKKVGLKLSNKDVFVNVVGGITVRETSIDLAVCMAIISSYYDTIIPDDHCFIAEVGLCGELMNVHSMVNRTNTAIKHNFSKISVAYDKNQPLNKYVVKYNSINDIMNDYIRK